VKAILGLKSSNELEEELSLEELILVEEDCDDLLATVCESVFMLSLVLFFNMTRKVKEARSNMKANSVKVYFLSIGI